MSEGDSRPKPTIMVWLQLIEAFRWVPSILASAVPLWALQPVAESLAGQNTNVNVTIGVSVVVSVATTATTVVKHRQLVSTKAEVSRLETRNARLEAIVEERGLDKPG